MSGCSACSTTTGPGLPSWVFAARPPRRPGPPSPSSSGCCSGPRPAPVVAATDGGVLDDRGVDATAYRERAQRAVREGDWDTVVLDSYRAVVASAVERTILDELPGRTAHEASLELSRAFPTEDGRPAPCRRPVRRRPLRARRRAREADARAVLALDERLARARPELSGSVPASVSVLARLAAHRPVAARRRPSGSAPWPSSPSCPPRRATAMEPEGVGPAGGAALVAVLEQNGVDVEPVTSIGDGVGGPAVAATTAPPSSSPTPSNLGTAAARTLRQDSPGRRPHRRPLALERPAARPRRRRHARCPSAPACRSTAAATSGPSTRATRSSASTPATRPGATPSGARVVLPAHHRAPRTARTGEGDHGAGLLDLPSSSGRAAPHRRRQPDRVRQRRDHRGGQRGHRPPAARRLAAAPLVPARRRRPRRPDDERRRRGRAAAAVVRPGARAARGRPRRPRARPRSTARPARA